MSALSDQAARLRALAQKMELAPRGAGAVRASDRARVIAVASGKGGVGKTNIAVNLAIALADAGRETVLIDGDFGLGNADMLCGVSPGGHVGAVVQGRRSLEDIAVRYRPRMRLVPCGSGVASLADLDAASRRRFMESFGELERTAEVMILDCGAGLGAVVLDLLALADLTMIVTTPEPTSIADAYGVIKTVATRDPKPAARSVQLVVNQASSLEEARSVHARVSAVCDRFLGFGVPFAGMVSLDARVSQSVRMRKPMLLAHPRCAASRDVRSLSVCLEAGLMKPRGAGCPEQGLLERLWRVLGGAK
ncbi:MAG: MinD/ParA family protein [Phycisphaerae bacterium]|nr:MinD/ParA family protein [Phycisphaerae bacterium]